MAYVFCLDTEVTRRNCPDCRDSNDICCVWYTQAWKQLGTQNTQIMISGRKYYIRIDVIAILKYILKVLSFVIKTQLMTRHNVVSKSFLNVICVSETVVKPQPNTINIIFKLANNFVCQHSMYLYMHGTGTKSNAFQMSPAF